MELDFKHDYILEDNAVLLEPLSMKHFPFLLPYSINEPGLWKFSLLPADSEENLKKYINDAEKGRKENKEYPFAVFNKRNNKYAGSTRFYDIQTSLQTLQLGYTWYGGEFHGSGLNKHCKFLLLEFAFELLKTERVEFRADNENERSIAAMKSLGCKVDGILRSNMPKRQGGRRDSIVLSILKEEWFENVKANLQAKLK